MAKVCHYTEVEAQVFGDEAPGTTIRWVIDEEHDGAPNYAMRVIEVAPGGHTPYHTHWAEHENFVFEGQGTVTIGEETYPIKPGYVIYVPPWVKHQYVNTGDTPLKFICSIPTSRHAPNSKN